MSQNQPSGRGLLPSPTAWSPDQHLAAMLADVSQHTLGRIEGRGLGFGQLVRTHTGKCLKCHSSSDGHSYCAQAIDSGLLGPQGQGLARDKQRGLCSGQKHQEQVTSLIRRRK